MKKYYIYILTNKARGALYVGVTNDGERRFGELPHSGQGHRSGLSRLVHIEQTERRETAIARKRQLNGWHREWKINLVEMTNPTWRDLSCE